MDLANIGVDWLRQARRLPSRVALSS